MIAVISFGSCGERNEGADVDIGVVTVSPRDATAIVSSVVELVEVDVIGEDVGDGQLAPVFATVTNVITDAAASVYVYDSKTSSIHIFDSQFNYQESIGGRGSGLGEFMSVTVSRPLADGRVLFVDAYQKRVSWWDPAAETMTTTRVTYTSFDALVETSDSTFIAYEFNRDAPERPLFYVLDTNLDSKLSNFGGFNQIRRDTSALSKLLMEQGNLLARRAGDILFAPNAYEGIVYNYERAGQSWTLSRRIIGRTVDRAYETIDPQRTSPGLVFTLRGRKMYGRLRSGSSLLAELRDGRIVHLSSRWEENETYPHPHIEVFDRDLHLVSHGDLIAPESGSCNHCFLPLWVDDLDRLYAVDPLNGMTVRIFEMQLDKRPQP
jgi:hypothetical protein